jgi:N-methylhydantoinase A
MRDVGRPLGLGLHAAAQAIFQLACERMVTAIEEITLKQGIDARNAVLIGGGGGAGLYSATIARRLGVDRVVIPAVAAALSAAGALLSDLTDDVAVTAFASTRSFDLALAARVLGELRTRAEAFIAGPGAATADHDIRFSVEARYPNQVWEIEVPLPEGGLPDEAAVAAFRDAFHRVHDDLFAFSDPGSEVEIVSWRAHVRCGLPRTAMDDLRPARDDMPAGTRLAYFPETGEVQTAVRRYGSLGDGERIAGPVIVESAVTTVVVPPGAAIAMLPSGSLLLEPHAGGAAVGHDLEHAA